MFHNHERIPEGQSTEQQRRYERTPQMIAEIDRFYIEGKTVKQTAVHLREMFTGSSQTHKNIIHYRKEREVRLEEEREQNDTGGSEAPQNETPGGAEDFQAQQSPLAAWLDSEQSGANVVSAHAQTPTT